MNNEIDSESSDIIVNINQSVIEMEFTPDISSRERLYFVLGMLISILLLMVIIFLKIFLF